MAIREAVKGMQKRRRKTTSFTNKGDRPPINPDEASVQYYKRKKAKNQETVPSGTKAITKNVDKENAPSYMKKTTKPSASTMDGNAYTPTQLKPVGPDMGKVNRNTKGNSVPGSAAVKKKAPVNPALVSKNTPSSVNRMDKKKPSTKKKSRGLVTMTSMQNKYL